MNKSDREAIKGELDRLTSEFFRAVSFEEGGRPPFENLYGLFIEKGLLIKNASATPEICSVSQFIEPRNASVLAGDLTRFNESELAEVTQIFGNVAHRLNSYVKSGTLKGVPFVVRGMISTQFVSTPEGWKISSMAWDDERPGFSVLKDYEPMPATAP